MNITMYSVGETKLEKYSKASKNIEDFGKAIRLISKKRRHKTSVMETFKISTGKKFKKLCKKQRKAERDGQTTQN